MFALMLLLLLLLLLLQKVYSTDLSAVHSSLLYIEPSA